MIKDVKYLKDEFEIEFEFPLLKSTIDDTEPLRHFFEKISSVNGIRIDMKDNAVSGLAITYQEWLNLVSSRQPAENNKQLEREFEAFFENAIGSND